MKTLISSFTIFVLISAVLLPGVHADHNPGHYWDVDISTPSDITSRNRVQLDFTTLSTNNSDAIELELYRNGSQVDDASTTDGGDSGRLIANLPSDGVHELRVEATNGSESEDFEYKVTRDTQAPSAPDYQGSSRVNGQYEVNFAASDNDTARIYLFSSASPTFTANESTYEDDVEATGSDQSITYEAPSSSERFHAVIAVDRAGNISEPVGDPETDVETIEDGTIPAPGASTATTASTPGAAGADAADADAQEDGEVAGDTDEEDGDTLSTSDQQDEGEVAGEIDDTTSAWWWLLLVAALGAAGYLYYRKRQKARTL